MENEPRKYVTTIELAPDEKRWLERQTAQRIIDGRPHGERSMNAVIRDLINTARSESGDLVEAQVA